MICNIPEGSVCTASTIDLGKKLIHVVRTDPSVGIVQRVKFGVQPCWRFRVCRAVYLIGMQACPRPQWLARKLQWCGYKCVSSHCGSQSHV